MAKTIIAKSTLTTLLWVSTQLIVSPSSMAQSFDEDFDDTTEKERDAIKVIILGDSAVGKTKLMERFLLDKLFVNCFLVILC